MRADSGESTTNAVDSAIQFVAAQSGGPARLLAIHKPSPQGQCDGCSGHHPVRWPCSTAEIARRAAVANGTTPAADTGP